MIHHRLSAPVTPVTPVTFTFVTGVTGVTLLTAPPSSAARPCPRGGADSTHAARWSRAATGPPWSVVYPTFSSRAGRERSVQFARFTCTNSQTLAAPHAPFLVPKYEQGLLATLPAGVADQFLEGGCPGGQRKPPSSMNFTLPQFESQTGFELPTSG